MEAFGPNEWLEFFYDKILDMFLVSGFVFQVPDVCMIEKH